MNTSQESTTSQETILYIEIAHRHQLGYQKLEQLDVLANDGAPEITHAAGITASSL